MNVRIFDIETKGFLKETNHIHCLVYFDLNTKTFESVTDYKEIKKLFEEEDVIWAGHSIVRYDFPYLEQCLGVKCPKFVIDTLAISWYLYPERDVHGLEEWGEQFGVKKPVVKDWSALTVEEYVHRCEEDVKINTMLWNRERKFLMEIYDTEEAMIEFLKYLHFKMDCIREQEAEGLQIDVEGAASSLEMMETEKADKTKQLEEVMPKIPVKGSKTYKNVIITPAGQILQKGDLFYEDALKHGGGEFKEKHKIETIRGYKEPNSGSHAQIKAWLYSLGWVPEHIKHVRDKKKNTTKQIPQVASKTEQGEVCISIKKLFEKEPRLELLNGLSILAHRISILKGFLKDQKDGIIYPSAGGLTNTLRLKHRVIQNLPAVYKKYGKEIRGCIIAKPGCVLMGADLSNIEDRTKRHYIYKYDPKYVEDMNTPGYDAHLELGILAGFLTKEEADWYKWYEQQTDLASKKEIEFIPTAEQKSEYKRLKEIRNKSKVTNFSATYKVGAEALSRNANIPLSVAKKLLKIYWERNDAILKVEMECLIKEVDSTRWLQNPISKFWYSLRNDKDKFSTLNQGSAVFMFDMWLMEQRNLGLKIPFQYHDEDLLNVKNDQIEEDRAKINKAMEIVNERFPLNVPIGCSINVGMTYAETH